MSSVSIWVRTVALTPEQQRLLDQKNPAQTGSFWERPDSARCRAARRDAQSHGRQFARAGDQLHRMVCMLYWAEGTKRRNTNADADLARALVRFVRFSYGVDDDQLRFSVDCFVDNGLPVDQIEAWWLGRLSLSASFRKAAVNRVSWASKRLKGHVLPTGPGACP